MSFIARHVYTYKEFVLVTEAPQCNRMTAPRQDTDNKKNYIQIYKIDNMQNSNNTIYKGDNLVCTSMLGVHLKCKCMCVLNKCIIVLCVPSLLSSIHEMDCLREETVSVSGLSGAQCSVASTRR